MSLAIKKLFVLLTFTVAYFHALLSVRHTE